MPTRHEPGQLAVITGVHPYQGCICCVSSHVAGVICLVALANGQRVAASYGSLTAVSMEQLQAGDVECITPEQARSDFNSGCICTCMRRLPRWRIGEVSG